MKCVFAAMPYQFSVEYHASALVAAHADKAWVMHMDGVDMSYRLQPCQGTDGRTDPHCAVFVPSTMGDREAGRMLTAFQAAHPGVIPAHVVFQFEPVRWWRRARLSPRSPLDYNHQ
jgi:hypothetical protein